MTEYPTIANRWRVATQTAHRDRIEGAWLHGPLQQRKAYASPDGPLAQSAGSPATGCAPSPIKPAQHPRHGFGQILRNEPRAKGAGAGAVDPDGGASGLEEGHALRQQATGEARQHIP